MTELAKNLSCVAVHSLSFGGYAGLRIAQCELVPVSWWACCCGMSATSQSFLFSCITSLVSKSPHEAICNFIAEILLFHLEFCLWNISFKIWTQVFRSGVLCFDLGGSQWQWKEHTCWFAPPSLWTSWWSGALFYPPSQQKTLQSLFCYLLSHYNLNPKPY